MLIIGNSHVSMFEFGLESTQQIVQVKWLGALRCEHLLEEYHHPARDEFWKFVREETGWVCVFLGNHDLVALWSQIPEMGLERALKYRLQLWEQFWALCSRRSNFCLLHAVQQTLNVVPPDQEKHFLQVAKLFWQQAEPLLKKYGIAVLDPLSEIRLPDYQIPQTYLQSDGLHLKHEYAHYYVTALSALTGDSLQLKKAQATVEFPTDTELGSAASLVINQLIRNLPLQSVSLQNFEQKLHQKIKDLLQSHGMDQSFDRYTPVLSNGWLDSMDLADLFSCAHEWAHCPMNFEKNVREYENIDGLCRLLAPENHKDLFNLFRQSFEDSPSMMLEADQMIEKQKDVLSHEYEKIVEISMGAQHPYGILFYWEALLCDHPLKKGDLLVRAVSSPMPVDLERVLCLLGLHPLDVDALSRQNARSIVTNVFFLQAMLRMGKTSHLTSIAQILMGLFPEHPMVLKICAEIFLQLGQPILAHQIVSHFRVISPLDADFMALQIQCEQRLGEAQNLKDAYVQLMDLYPYHPLLQHLVASS